MSLLGSTPPQIRTQLRNQMIAAGVPSAIADESVDLGIHASEAARQLLADTTSRGSGTPVKTAVFSIAVGLTTNALSGSVEAMMEAAAREGHKGMSIMAQYGGLASETPENVR